MPCWDLRKLDNLAMRFVLSGVLGLPEPHLLLCVLLRVLPQPPDRLLSVFPASRVIFSEMIIFAIRLA